MSDWFPTPSRPLPVEGGLKARSTRGAIAQTWWSQRFIEVMENIVVGGRLQRGRNYARRGQVISLGVSPGEVTAAVQGSTARPYRVRIRSDVFGDPQWARVESALAENAWYAAALLSGEMPSDIEDVFDSVGLALFPATARELSMECSCPDFAVPCKHLAATFYLLAESFDDDPFRILAWRGRERDDLLANLESMRSAGRSAGGRAESLEPPLEQCLSSFYERQAQIPVPNRPGTSSAALLDQLPEVVLTVRGRALVDLLRPLYAALGVEQDLAETVDRQRD